MAIPSTGPISMGMIQTEFGGSNPAAINEYYRGGAYVPNTGTNAGVPTSGAISFSQFRGASKDLVYLANTSQTHNAIAPNNAYAGLEFTSSLVRGRTGSTTGSTNTKYTWLLAGSASSYQVRATLSSGTGPAGNPLSTWITMGSVISWYLQRTTNGETSCVLSIQVREASSGTVLSSCTFSLSALREA